MYCTNEFKFNKFCSLAGPVSSHRFILRLSSVLCVFVCMYSCVFIRMCELCVIMKCRRRV